MVTGCELLHGASATEVGSIRELTFIEGTRQHVQLTGLSDELHEVSYSLIESVPAVDHLGASHTIRLFRVTADNTTFLQWTSRYAGNTRPEVIEDSRWKKRDAFEHLLTFLPAHERELLDVWERFTATHMCQVFSTLPPQAALSKEDLQRVWERFDENKDGDLSQDELTKLLEEVFDYMQRHVPARLRDLLEFDDLEEEEQKEAETRLQLIGKELREAEVKVIAKEMMILMDLNQDGKITEEEFISTFQDAMQRAVKKHRLSED